eukprot:Skav222042  [mRNA]  locus=scaffold1020:296950:297708:- [translate_table: standard]
MVYRPLQLVLGILRLVVALADSECSSLLMKQKSDWSGIFTGSFQTDKKAGGAITCSEQQGGLWTSTHENTLGFQVCKYDPVGGGCSWYPTDPPDAHISSMVPTSYAITVGQPVPTNCFATGSSTFTFTAGRKGSSGASEFFMTGLNSDSIMVNNYDSSGEVPDKLNFVLEGDVSFAFGCNASVGPVLSARLRFGQGHPTATNNWWMGGSDCQMEVTDNGKGLNCGPLRFFSSTRHKFALEPSAGWDTYCKST